MFPLAEFIDKRPVKVFPSDTRRSVVSVEERLRLKLHFEIQCLERKDKYWQSEREHVRELILNPTLGGSSLMMGEDPFSNSNGLERKNTCVQTSIASVSRKL